MLRPERESRLVEMVSSLLSLDPSARPSIPHVMAHYWLAPQLYKIPTSLGALPVHPKSASRSRHRKRQVWMVQCARAWDRPFYRGR